jgi:hypothetical protein
MLIARFSRMAVFLPALLFVAACATPGPVLTESVGTIRTGLALADEQSNAAMVNANTLSREQSLEFKVTEPETNLREADFIEAVRSEDIRAWDKAFSALDDYLAALQKLVAPERAQETGNQILAVGEALQGSAFRVGVPTGLAEVFAGLGSALVQVQAERKATNVMRQVDPAFQRVVQGMASAIGADDSANLRGTVRTNWERVLSRLRTRYAAIQPTLERRTGERALTNDQIENRRQIANDFVTAIESRDESDASLAQLRASMLALGEAHHSAAQGKPGDALFWIERISAWVQQARERIEAKKKGDDT